MAGKFCISLTCGKDNTDKATVAFVVANAAVASAEAKLAATKEATAIVIAAIKESAASAIAATEAKLAAAEKVIARMEASASVAAELATLKAMKSEPKRE